MTILWLVAHNCRSVQQQQEQNENNIQLPPPVSDQENEAIAVCQESSKTQLAEKEFHPALQPILRMAIHQCTVQTTCEKDTYEWVGTHLLRCISLLLSIDTVNGVLSIFYLYARNPFRSI